MAAYSVWSGAFLLVKPVEYFRSRWTLKGTWEMCYDIEAPRTIRVLRTFGAIQSIMGIYMAVQIAVAILASAKEMLARY